MCIRDRYYDGARDLPPEEHGGAGSYENEIYEETSGSNGDIDDDSGFSSVGFFHGERAVKPASEAKGFFGEVSSEDGAFYDDIAEDDEDSVGDSDMYGAQADERSKHHTPDAGVSENQSNYDEDAEYYGSHSAKKSREDHPSTSTFDQEGHDSGVTSIEEMLKAWDTAPQTRYEKNSDDFEANRAADSDTQSDESSAEVSRKPSPCDDVWSQMVSEFGNIIEE